MTAESPQFLEVGDGAARRRIAYLVGAEVSDILSDTQAPRSPEASTVSDQRSDTSALGVFWLSGFKSDMISTKAAALAEWAAARGHGCTRFDYSGHGQSEGRFEDGTIGRWLEEAEAAFTRLTHGPQIVVGSSMGGYIALLLLRRLMAHAPEVASRLGALVLIAPAWDMTEELMWNRFSASARAAIEQKGVFMRPSSYGDPYPITRQLIEEGRNHLFARRTFDPGRPVRIMHGLQDPDVPWEHTLDLASFLDGDWTEVAAVPDGEHRLSRPQDLALLFEILDEVAGKVDGY